AGDLLRQGHCKAVDARLGRGVVGLAELAFLSVDRADVDDAPPLLVDHAFDDLLGDIEQAVQIGIDDGAPVFAAHLAEQAVARNAGIVHQYADDAEFLPDLVKSLRRGIPVGDIPDRCMEFIAQCRLFIQPLLVIAARAATGNDGIPLFCQPLADRGPDASHTPGNVCQFPTHVLLLVSYFAWPPDTARVRRRYRATKEDMIPPANTASCRPDSHISSWSIFDHGIARASQSRAR